MTLGARLAALRIRDGLTLRQVEEATCKRVSNAYLSQIESGKISRPSPDILFALAEVYGYRYDLLMEEAGYISARGASENVAVATHSFGKLSKEEEDQLLHYLSFLRHKKKRNK